MRQIIDLPLDSQHVEVFTVKKSNLATLHVCSTPQKGGRMKELLCAP